MVYSGKKRAGSSSYNLVKLSKKARSMPVSQAIKSGFVKGRERIGGFYGRFTGRNAENKFFDTALSFGFDNTGEVPATGQLALIPQGVTESTRVGRKCVIKSIQLRGQLTYTPGASAGGACVGYMYLVWDKQCNGAAAAMTDVLTSAAGPTGLINLANSERFVVLRRWHVPFNSSAGVTTAYATRAVPIDYFKKCNIPIEFSSTTGAITEIKSNNLFLLAQSSIEDDLIAMSGAVRLRFSDN